MTFDSETVAVINALVIFVCGATFIVNTFMRKDDASGRVWSVSYMAGMFTSFSYVVSALSQEAWWATAAGNGGYVLSIAALWSGARLFNGKSSLLWVSLIGTAVTIVAALAAGPSGGPWAGAPATFLCIALFAGLGTAETLVGAMRDNPTTRGFTIVLGIASLFFAARLITLLVEGPDGALFTTLFGTVAASLLLIALLIVATVVLSVLRAERAAPASRRHGSIVAYTGDDVLLQESFVRIVEDWLERANFHDEQLAILHVRLDDLDEMTTAFGAAFSSEVAEGFISSVRRYGPTLSDIGEDGAGCLLIATPAVDADVALQAAKSIQDGLLDHPVETTPRLRPTASIGIALTDYLGYDVAVLTRAAGDASLRAAAAGGNRTVLASSSPTGR
ncbi:diguanylate cyclase domain-containing protein [uncultured Plantibacter sp.]|uniref:diguanylate cyclase domain-containing protein n=1 Tax=uncultured Plantibacter sp. TaxID=293337 RepID=UPI0028D46886|nr:diguanylate cyclase [uncultured Plantibacter sp.]